MSGGRVLNIMEDSIDNFAKLMVQSKVDIQDLIHNYPPEYKNLSKKMKYEEALSIFNRQKGTITLSRWQLGDMEEKALCIKKLLLL